MPVALRLPTWSHAEVLFTRNLSKGGMFLKTRKQLELHSQITLRVIPPSREEVELLAEVVHVSPEGSKRGPGVGLQFLEVSAETRAQIDALLARGQAMKHSKGGATAPDNTTTRPAPTQTPAPARPARPTREELLAELMRIRGHAAHEVLAVPADADSETITQAFERSMERYSPTRLGPLDDATTEVVKVLCTYLRYAYDELRKG